MSGSNQQAIATVVASAPNHLPTGTVSLSGTPTEGQTLTASNTLADADGLGAIRYQWLANGTPISGATAGTYTLTAADVGKTISVKASYTDGQGTAESITSNTTAAVAAAPNHLPTGTVTVTGALTEGQTLTASNDLADADGLGTIHYQWLANGAPISGATGSTHVLTAADVGKTIAAKASYTDGRGAAESVTSATSAAVAPISNHLPTGAVTVSGTLTEGQTLTASNTLADVDGLGTIHYQWLANGAPISGATTSTYTLTAANVGKTIAAKASYMDGLGATESVTSAPTAAVAALPNRSPTGTVTVSGTLTEGQTLTASNTLADADGLGTVSYQWLANGTAISGATGSTHILTASDVGKAIAAKASYTDGRGTAESVTSSATAAVAAMPNRLPTGAVTVSGTLTEGQTLTASNTLADADGLGTVSYQWLANGTPISGATAGTYALTLADVGKTISVKASYTDGRGTAESVTSATTAAVAPISNHLPTGAVNIFGTPTEGQTLTASNTLADADGLGTVSYQWLANGTPISGATASGYTLTAANVGKTISVKASYTDGRGTAESVTSATTAAVAALPNHAPTGAVTVSGTPTAGQTLTASNTLADADGLGTVSYQWLANGTPISEATTDIYTLTLADVGKAITVKASYMDGLGKAEYVTSAPTAAVATAPNHAPTGTVAVSGTPTEGQILTASNTLADADGLGLISYQWLANGTPISGATVGTYTPSLAEVGKIIAVKASYTDAMGTAESRTSAATAAVAAAVAAPNHAPTGTVSYIGTPIPGQTLLATNTLADVDGLGPITYQWQVSNSNVTYLFDGDSHTLYSLDVGRTVTLVATYTDGLGNVESVSTLVTATVSAAQPNHSPTGTVSIAGTTTQGQTLTASNNLTDADGLGAISYQWLADGTPISGATASTYTLTLAEVGKTMAVTASYTDALGTAESRTSEATAAVASSAAPPNHPPTGTLGITGTPTEGQTLAASNTLADADGLGTLHYQWLANGTPISGATGSTHTLTLADVGKTITVKASYTDGQGTAESLTSAATAPVATNLIAPDTTAPAAPTIQQVFDDQTPFLGPIASGATTNDTQPTITIIAAAGSTVRVFDNGAVLGMASETDTAGTFTFTPLTGLATGTHQITATAADQQGNPSAASAAFQVNVGAAGSLSAVADTTAPAAPVIAATSDHINRPALSMTAEAGSTVKVFDGALYLGDAIEGSPGQFSFTPAADLASGNHALYARAIDAAGNASVFSAALGYQVTGALSIIGNFAEDQTLSVSDSLGGSGTVHYQWLADGSAIAGQTGSSLILSQSEVGKAISVQATYDNLSATSNPTGSIANVNDAPVPGAITGDAYVGRTLTASAVTDEDGVGTLTYQWQADGVDIDGATGSTYLVGKADIDKQITVTLGYQDGQGTQETVTSAATAAVKLSAQTDNVIFNGNPDNRVNILYLGDGYLAEDIASGLYRSHVDNQLDYLFTEKAANNPYSRYASYFNAFSVNVVSNERGFDNRDLNTYVDTALGTTLFGTVALQVNIPLADAAVNAALAGTGVTTALRTVLVNSDYGGGTGGIYSTYSAATSGMLDVGVHESGHTLGKLADEYEKPGGAYTGPEPFEPDITIDPSGAKWAYWLGQYQPGVGVIGVYEGAYYRNTGVYRPSLISKMRDNYSAFNLPSMEALILAFYKKTNPLDAYSAASPGATSFTATPIDPYVIRLKWVVDGVETDNHSSFLDISQLAAGAHTVQLTAWDDTPWVRPAYRDQITQTVTWNVTTTAATTLTAANDVYAGTANGDWIQGGSGDDALSGVAGNDRLDGGLGNDTILGGTGDDVLIGGPGINSLNGGAGVDTVSYAALAVPVTVDLNLATPQQTTQSSIDTLIQIENVVGGTGNDRLTGNSLANMLDGGAGNDTLAGGAGNDILIGGSGDDRLQGDAGNDVLYGDDGHDFLDGGDGNDYLDSGNGNDVLNGGAGEDVLLGGAGNDALNGGDNADTLTGGEGKDVINAGAGDDSIIGGNGNDIIDGGAGSDTLDYSSVTAAMMVDLRNTSAQDIEGAGHVTISNVENITGGAGNDVLIGDAQANTLQGGPGSDWLVGSTGNDILVGGIGGGNTAVYSLSTSALTVTLTADKGSTVLGTIPVAKPIVKDALWQIQNVTGSAYDDKLIGNDDANILAGRQGADTLTGGLGNDTFVFDTAIGGTVDTITDFTVGADTIGLDAQICPTLLWNADGSLLASELFVTGGVDSASCRLYYDSTSGMLSYDGDGSGSVFQPVAFAAIGSGLALDNHSFTQTDAAGSPVGALDWSGLLPSLTGKQIVLTETATGCLVQAKAGDGSMRTLVSLTQSAPGANAWTSTQYLSNGTTLEKTLIDVGSLDLGLAGYLVTLGANGVYRSAAGAGNDALLLQDTAQAVDGGAGTDTLTVTWGEQLPVAFSPANNRTVVQEANGWSVRVDGTLFARLEQTQAGSNAYALTLVNQDGSFYTDTVTNVETLWLYDIGVAFNLSAGGASRSANSQYDTPMTAYSSVWRLLSHDATSAESSAGAATVDLAKGGFQATSGALVLVTADAGQFGNGGTAFVDSAPAAGDLIWVDAASGQQSLISHSAAAGNTTSAGVAATQLGVTADGQYVVFSAADASQFGNGGTAFGDGAPSATDLFAYRVSDGTLALISHDASGQTNASTATDTSFAGLSQDGTYAFFSARDATKFGNGGTAFTDLVPLAMDVFAYRFDTGTLSLLSHAAGNPTKSAGRVSTYAGQTPDGQYVILNATDVTAYGYSDSNTVANDLIAVKLSDGSQQLLTHAAGNATTSTGGGATLAGLSQDGQYAILSTLDVTGYGFTDGNSANDDLVAVKLSDGSQHLLTHTGASATTSGISRAHYLTTVGSKVYFMANDATQFGAYSDSDPNTRDLFSVDLQTGVTTLISTPTAGGTASFGGALLPGSTVVSPDGRYVAFSEYLPVGSYGDFTVNTQGGGVTFVLDTQADTLKMVTHGVNVNATEAYSTSVNATVNGFTSDGQTLIFSHELPRDLGDAFDSASAYKFSKEILTYDTATGAMRLLTHTPDSSQNYSSPPASRNVDYDANFQGLSADDQWVLFTANDATQFGNDRQAFTDSNSSAADLLATNLNTGEIRLLSGKGGVSDGSENKFVGLSQDGNFAYYSANDISHLQDWAASFTDHDPNGSDVLSVPLNLIDLVTASDTVGAAAGTAFDNATQSHNLTLTALLAPQQSGLLFDGDVQVGTATADASGVATWHLNAVASGSHLYTVHDTQTQSQILLDWSQAASRLNVTVL